MARRHWASIISGRRLLAFIDNSAARSVCIKLSSTNKYLNALAERLAEDELTNPSFAFYHRVPTKSNIADGPSRLNFAELEGLYRVMRSTAEFPDVQELSCR
jgi:hypothetical protein